MIIVLMGVTGSGKSTVGKLLARQLGWQFFEGDDFHSPANIEKLRRGEPLNDSDRGPWRDAIGHPRGDRSGRERRHRLFRFEAVLPQVAADSRTSELCIPQSQHGFS